MQTFGKGDIQHAPRTVGLPAARSEGTALVFPVSPEMGLVPFQPYIGTHRCLLLGIGKITGEKTTPKVLFKSLYLVFSSTWH